MCVCACVCACVYVCSYLHICRFGIWNTGGHGSGGIEGEEEGGGEEGRGVFNETINLGCLIVFS